MSLKPRVMYARKGMLFTVGKFVTSFDAVRLINKVMHEV